MNPPQAVVFLGNPGREYHRTRHNVGFLVADRWLEHQTPVWQKKFKGEWATVVCGVAKLSLLKPLTFMNLAGESARAMGDFFKLPVDAWVAVHDDIDLPFGEVRFQTGGGLGGHNGLRSLRQHLGTDGFHRLRVGIGRPVHGNVADFVLGRFSPEEEIELSRVLDRAAGALDEAFRRS
jgi:peptidyl-tRNA hydrolase, PTH1 family